MDWSSGPTGVRFANATNIPRLKLMGGPADKPPCRTDVVCPTCDRFAKTTNIQCLQLADQRISLQNGLMSSMSGAFFHPLVLRENRSAQSTHAS